MSKSKYVYVLRVCDADMTSRNDFRWPEAGMVECPDWDAKAECGNGLHGWMHGEGDHAVGNINPDSKWLVVKVLRSDVVDLVGKVKFPRCEVVYCGDKHGAGEYLRKYDKESHGKAVIGATVVCGDGGMILAGAYGVGTGGDCAKVTGGDCATVTGGDCATVTGGDGATVTGGDCAKVTGGDCATVTGGDCATVTGGDCAKVTGGNSAKVTGGYGATVTGGDGAKVTGGDGTTVTGGDGATVTGGDCAKVTGGDCATVTGGNGATVTGGNRATVTGGIRCELRLSYWDDAALRRRTVIAYVGEGGIEAGVAYRLDDSHCFVKVQS
jgi:hypothetical protein